MKNRTLSKFSLKGFFMKKVLPYFLLFALPLFFIGCGGDSSSGEEPQVSQREVKFSGLITALKIPEETRSLKSSLDVFKGKAIFYKENVEYEANITLQSDGFSIIDINMSLALFPGEYEDFVVDVNGSLGNLRAEADEFRITENKETELYLEFIPVQAKKGGVVGDVLRKISFNFTTDVDLSSMEDPRLHIGDDAYVINRKSRSIDLYIDEVEQNTLLEFFNGEKLKADGFYKKDERIQTMRVIYGILGFDASFKIEENGTVSALNIEIPEEVFELQKRELSAILYYDSKKSYGTIFENSINFDVDGVAENSVLDIGVQIYDGNSSSKELLAESNETNISLSEDLVFDFTIYDTRYVRILIPVGINVFQENGDLIKNASIYANGIPYGNDVSDDYFTVIYLELGKSYVIEAIKDGKKDSRRVEIEKFEPYNLNLELPWKELSRTHLSNCKDYVKDGSVVIDDLTGLKWEDTDKSITYYTFVEAQAHCSELKLDGLSWRMPTLKELWYLAESKDYLFSEVFEQKTDGNYWTSDKSGSEVWGVNFNSKTNLLLDSGDTSYVRCVSGEISDFENFERENKVVVDKENDLIWQDANLSTPLSRNDAKEHCLNLKFAGHTDWQLPTISQLFSIANLKENPFASTLVGEYWSETKKDSSNSWFVNFSTDTNGHSANTNPKRVRCIRDANPVRGEATFPDNFLNRCRTFKKTGDVVIDDVTSLKWEDRVGKYGSMAEAKTYCENLTTGGIENWRLPTLTELWYFINANRQNSNLYNTFDYLGNYRTQTESSSGNNWSVYLSTGEMYEQKTTPYYKNNSWYHKQVTKCVSGESDYTLNTQRDEISDTVIDKGNNLMWQDSGLPGEMSLEEAKTYCSTSTFAGYSSWRLPTIEELFSIRNASFENTSIGSFWSKSKYGGSNFWYMNFDNTQNSYTSDSNSLFFVRCVRDQ